MRGVTALACPQDARIDDMEKDNDFDQDDRCRGMLSVMTAAPAFAQAAIQEPGLFAFYHPNLDALNGGAPTPAYRLQSLRLRRRKLMH